VCLSVSLKRAADTFSLLSVSGSVSSNTPHPTPHAVYDTWAPPAGARARRELRRGERKCGNGERRDTTSILRRGMRSLLERATVPQTAQNGDAESDTESCWSWSNALPPPLSSSPCHSNSSAKFSHGSRRFHPHSIRLNHPLIPPSSRLLVSSLSLSLSLSCADSSSSSSHLPAAADAAAGKIKSFKRCGLFSSPARSF
jgi:hypothetical protein